MYGSYKKSLILGALALLLSCAFTSNAVAASKTNSVYFIFTGYAYPYFAPMANAVKQAAKNYPKLSIKIVSASNSSTKEIAAIKAATAAGADGIILNPVQKSVTFAAKQAMKEGIPVITIDRDVGKASARVAYIGADDYVLGKRQTQFALKALAKKDIPKPWNVVILQGTLGSSTAMERLKGEMDVLKPLVKKGKINIILNQPANFKTGKAQSIISTLLAKTTDIQLIICGNDAMALGAIHALESHNIQPGEDTFVVGVDAQPGSLHAIKTGTQLATVAHSPFIEAYWAVEAMHNLLAYGIKPPKDKFENGAVIIPVTIVSKQNVSKISAWGTPEVIPPLPYGKAKSYKVKQEND